MAHRRKRTKPTGPRPIKPRDLETYRQWRQICELIQACRGSGVPTAANNELARLIAADPSGTLAPFLQLWLADNHVLAGELRPAIAAYRQVHAEHRGRRYCGEALGAIALRSAAHAHERLKEVPQALATLAEAAERYAGSSYPGELAYTAGCMAERAGLYPEAMKAFATAAKVRDHFHRGAAPYRDLASRGLRRLRSKRTGVRPTAHVLAVELAAALVARDSGALKNLASPTHFSIAVVNSERGFVDAAPVLDVLLADLATSDLRVAEGLAGSGEKRYLDTVGWKGRLGSDHVRFILNWAPGGYEWGGIAIVPASDASDAHRLLAMARPPQDDDGGKPLPGDPFDPPDVPDPAEPPEPPPAGVSGNAITVADLAMKSPWVRGTHFYAGGIAPFAAHMATTKLVAAVLTPIFASLVIDALFPKSDCGFGFGGLYYGQPTTHVGTSFFAVDFATSHPVQAALVPLEPLTLGLLLVESQNTFGQPCLAVADGIVSVVQSATPTGGTTVENVVSIAHITGKEQGAVVIAYFIALLTGVMPALKLRYSAQYLHLDGPARIPVSIGMYVKQGKRLGLMDDTGNSAGHHLHFALWDNAVGSTVRPTPMDGQSLWEWDDGRCMHSTNVPIP